VRPTVPGLADRRSLLRRSLQEGGGARRETEARAVNGRMIDKRYGTRRWKAVRLQVLHRDLWSCYVGTCEVSASVADHIIPVSPEMPDWMFFDPNNLRGSCKRHNTARGVAARLERDLAGIETRPRNPLVVPFRRVRSR
jgi:hypothetical protein